MRRSTIERDLDRIGFLLDSRIRQRGFTQEEVQENLGWGRNYISRLVYGQKKLRLEQILMILNVIDVDPAEFWGELYPFDRAGKAGEKDLLSQDGLDQLGRSKLLLDGVIRTLVKISS